MVRKFGTVILDCDSTLSAMEGIGELAVAHKAEVEALTDAAMRGEIALEEVYGRRLGLVRPTREAVEAVGRLYVERLVPDAREVVAALRSEGVEVRILSGGVAPAVLVVARELGVPDELVAAVHLHFDDGGSYVGFDQASPAARSGGKAELIRRWSPPPAPPVMLVGDGQTDLEAAGAVDLFVGFAGVIERPVVAAGAPVLIRDRSLSPVLPLALAGRPPADPRFIPTFEKGLELLEERGKALLP